MKIGCPCGNTIRDNTDCLPGKASLIPDQDIETALACARGTTLDPAAQRDWDDIHGRSTTMYQCDECGRLAIDGPGMSLWWFEPAEPRTPKSLLASVYGDAWRGHLIARWDSGRTSGPRGHVYWDDGATDGGFEELDDFDAFRAEYNALLPRLRDRDVLRSALLRVDGETEHHWTLESPKE